MPKMAKGFTVIKNSPPAMPDHMGGAAPAMMGKGGGQKFNVGRTDRVVKSSLGGKVDGKS